jgi:hypothetical protein
LNARHAPKVTLATLMQPFSTDRLRQRSLWGVLSRQTEQTHAQAKCCLV